MLRYIPFICIARRQTSQHYCTFQQGSLGVICRDQYLVVVALEALELVPGEKKVHLYDILKNT